MAKNGRHLFTSESVTEGHPDKIADQISDAVLDALLAQDPMSRVACETWSRPVWSSSPAKSRPRPTSTSRRSSARRSRTSATRAPKYGFDYETCAVISAIHEQSPDIAMGVDPGGAGDQGLMFGYACNETEELMPLPIMLAHKLTRRLSRGAARTRSSTTCVPTARARSRSSTRATSRCASTRSSSRPSTASLVKIETIREDVLEKVIQPVIPPNLLDAKTKYHINPTGRFVIGGPQGDSGLTGRKIIVDTYGGMGSPRRRRLLGQGPDEGGPLGVATWRATWRRTSSPPAWPTSVEVQIAYAIGVAEPVSVHGRHDGHGQGARGPSWCEAVREIFPLTPKGIIEYLDLRRPIYKKTAAYGHFGRCEPEFTWEATGKAAELKAFLKH